MVENIKRYLALPGDCLRGDSEFVVELKQTVVASVALELTLLLNGLTNSLRLQPSRGPSVLLQSIVVEHASRALVNFAEDGAVVVALGRNQGEYLQTVFLRAYRDQMADVNHVHIEGVCEGAEFVLTILFDVFREPMSASEAEKKLND